MVNKLFDQIMLSGDWGFCAVTHPIASVSHTTSGYINSSTVLFLLFWRHFKMAPLCSVAVQVPPLRMCSFWLLYVFFLFLFTHITSALISYDKIILLDIGQRYTNLLQDTLSTNPTWPLEILQNTEENNGHLNTPPEATDQEAPWNVRQECPSLHFYVFINPVLWIWPQVLIHIIMDNGFH